jgi:hypothetical protein
MDRYPVGIIPQEAKRLATSPHYRFRAVTGGYMDHVWHVTCIRLLLTKQDRAGGHGSEYRAYFQIDPVDDAIEDGLKTLMNIDRETDLRTGEEYVGAFGHLTNTFSIITYIWTAFLNEADTHLQLLVSLPPMFNTHLTLAE